MTLTNEQAFYDYIKRWIGTPYLWGGDDLLAGIDCSGLVLELLKAVGEWPDIDTTAQGLFNHYRDKSDWNKKTFGSLAFYGRSQTDIGHVAFCINPHLCIEAGGGDSRTVTRDAAIRQNAFVRLRPIDRRKDLVSVLRPHYKLFD